MRLIALTLLALSALPSHALDCAATDLNFDARRLMGKPENLCQSYVGKVVLAVNVASHCGYTPQYQGLEKLYQTYKDRGLVVLGFPSDQFGGQEFADDQQIQKFCKANYGVSFPMFSRGSVKGPDASPFYKRLIEKTGESPAWNFNKYLIGRDGVVRRHFSSDVTPDAATLIKQIEEAIASK